MRKKHGMRYTLFRGLAQVSKWGWLKFAAMNLKKFALHAADGDFLLVLLIFIPFFES